MNLFKTASIEMAPGQVDEVADSGEDDHVFHWLVQQFQAQLLGGTNRGEVSSSHIPINLVQAKLVL